MTQIQRTRLPLEAYKKPTYMGVKYPLREDNLLALVNDAHAINSSLYLLLMTEPGERLMEPQLGTPLRDLLFESIEMVIPELSQRILYSVTTQETRIHLVSPGNSQTQSNFPISAISVEAIPSQQYAIQVKFRWQFKTNLGVPFDFDALISRRN